MRSDLRWCSDGFEFTCRNGEIVRGALAAPPAAMLTLAATTSTLTQIVALRSHRLSRYTEESTKFDEGPKELSLGPLQETGRRVVFRPLCSAFG